MYKQTLQVILTLENSRMSPATPAFKSRFTPRKTKNCSLPNWLETNSRCCQFHWKNQHHVEFKVSSSNDFNVTVKATTEQKTMPAEYGGFGGNAAQVSREYQLDLLGPVLFPAGDSEGPHPCRWPLSCISG